VIEAIPGYTLGGESDGGHLELLFVRAARPASSISSRRGAMWSWTDRLGRAGFGFLNHPASVGPSSSVPGRIVRGEGDLHQP